MKKKVLMIVTSNSRLGETGKLTGVYLPELAHPYQVFADAGYKIAVASPLGGDAPIDPGSLSPELEPYLQYAKNTLPLSAIQPGDYDAYFVVGGHGTMWDLSENADLQRILPAAYAQNKIVAAVCHGPAALVNLKDASGNSLLKGKRVAGFTNDEEAAAGLTAVVPFLLQDALVKAGGEYVKAPNWQAHVVVDGKLVTGQNPASAQGVGEEVARLLGL